MNNIELGKLLKLARQQKGLTQEQLAETLSVTTSAISKWENGKNLPDTDMLLKIALTLGLSIEDLYYPEQTIARLTNHTNSEDAIVPACVSEIPTQKETKKYNHKRYVPILIISVLLLLIVGGVFLHNYHNKQQTLNITQLAYRTTEDNMFGTIYEVACLYSGDLENAPATSQHIALTRKDWITNTYVSDDIIFMKVSFYHSQKAASEWDKPDKSIYIVR